MDHQARAAGHEVVPVDFPVLERGGEAAEEGPLFLRALFGAMQAHQLATYP